jgi:trimethylamine--corrinoid protein Co-methyltransferase
MGSSPRPDIQPLEAPLLLRAHGLEELEPLRLATLDILEHVGVQFPSEKATDVLASHGCGVDRTRHVVTFAPDLVAEALSRAPRSFVLGARDPSCDLVVGDGRTFCTTDGCGTKMVDFTSRELRPSTKDDLADVTRLQDALPGICFWWPTVGAGDCGETSQLHELDAGWNNTVKHLMGMVNGDRAARYAVEMARTVAGGDRELRRRPVMSDLIGTVSPLLQDRDGIEAALVFAEAGVPVCFVTMPTLGTTAPATRAGAFALGMAEVAAAVVLLELAVPGAPVLGSIMQSFADPRTGAFVSFPSDSRARGLATALIHHWGLPALAAACGTDSPAPGTWQAGVEEAFDLALAAREGADLLTSIGLVDVYTTFYPEHLLLGHDVLERARSSLLPVAVDDESLALEAVHDVGPGGHFLAHRHTRRHMRDALTRAVTHQPGPDGAYRDPVAVARDEAERLWREHRPEPLPDDVRAELGRILTVADAELRG